MCSFVCSGFLKRLFMPWYLHSWHLKLPRPLNTETYGRLPWQFCNFICEITNYRWNFAPKLRSNSSPMILYSGYLAHSWPLFFKQRLFLLIQWRDWIFPPHKNTQFTIFNYSNIVDDSNHPLATVVDLESRSRQTSMLHLVYCTLH